MAPYLQEEASFSWDEAYDGKKFETQSSMDEAGPTRLCNTGPTSIPIDPERIFRGRPGHGSNVAQRSEFMGNHYHHERDDYGQLVNIYSRVAVVVWPRRDRLKWMAEFKGIDKRVREPLTHGTRGRSGGACRSLLLTQARAAAEANPLWIDTSDDAAVTVLAEVTLSRSALVLPRGRLHREKWRVRATAMGQP